MFHDLTMQTIAALFFAGIGGGMLASMIGGAALVTYPALIAAGIPPLTATICNMTALVPGTFLAALSDRRQLPPFNRAFVGMVLASMIGAGLGAAILLATPQAVFKLLVPVLLGFATVLFAFAERIGGYLRARALARGREIDFSVTNLKVLLPVSFYGGYFGAGVGVLLLGVMSVATRGDYRSANVAKNFVTSLNSATAAAIFIWQGGVIWPQTLALMMGTIVGGLAGSWLARIVPRQVMRVAVVAVGALLTVVFAWRYWF
ncbi:MAG: sulfite exporter TauE/SafE family protein [Pseudolabrys sp.]